MKYYIFLLSITFCSIVKAESIDKLIAQTEKYLSIYEDSLCFYSMRSDCPEYHSLKDFNFTKEELKDIDIENDSIENWAVIQIFQSIILENIEKIAHHKDFPQKGSEFFLASPDNKLFNFRLFENTGGSYKSYISFMYYKEEGKVIKDRSNSEKSSEEEDFNINISTSSSLFICQDDDGTIHGIDKEKIENGDASLFLDKDENFISYVELEYSDDNDDNTQEQYGDIFEFKRDGYESIDTIQTNSGVKYLLQGSVVGCTTCLEEYITLIRFEKGEPICEFSYQLSTRFGSVEQFDYNAETKTITIIYETDDITSDCYCEQECSDDTYRGMSYYYEEGIPKYCRCIFVFNGETFELNESYWKKIKED